jgi:hypothetical protein
MKNKLLTFLFLFISIALSAQSYMKNSTTYIVEYRIWQDGSIVDKGNLNPLKGAELPTYWTYNPFRKPYLIQVRLLTNDKYWYESPNFPNNVWNDGYYINILVNDELLNTQKCSKFGTYDIQVQNEISKV